MPEKIIAFIVEAARKHARIVAALLLPLALAAAFYAATHFSINTDVTTLLDDTAEWRQNEIAFLKAFPERDDVLVIVVDGPDGVSTGLAAEKIAHALKDRPDLFKTVRRPEAHPYFTHYGLLLLPLPDLADATDQIIRAQPLLATLAADPSPRGLFGLLNTMADAVKAGAAQVADMNVLLQRLHRVLQKVLAHPGAGDAWAGLFASENPSKFERRRFVLARPVLDYAALSPGAAASDFVRKTVTVQDLENLHGVNVRLTGPVALADEEFASVTDGMQLALAVSLVLILFILLASLRSFRLIVPILITLLCGLAMTTALALMMVKALNLISVAFAVMFAGIAVDFGIQFGVRFRDAHHACPRQDDALRATARRIALPLTLAALSTAAAFLAFTPTSYRGLAELGLIAGCGMLIAFILNLTLLPALLCFTRPRPEPEAVGFGVAAPLDAMIETKRRNVRTLFAALAAIGLLLCFFLRFDFDPLNLKDPQTESVSTMMDLLNDPDTTPYTIDILAPSESDAETMAEKLAALPEVDKALTLQSLMPQDQPEKLALLQDVRSLLAVGLHPATVLPPPGAEEIRQTALGLAGKLKELGQDSASASLFSEDLRRFAALSNDTLRTSSASMRRETQKALAELEQRLTPHAIDASGIPGDLRAQWVTPDGRARIEVYPKGDPGKRGVLEQFAKAVRALAPGATGMVVSIQESSKTIRLAFVQAAVYSGVTTFILLLLFLRNFIHSLFVIAPLVLAFILTLGTAAAVNLPINFANIIALPLLLGLGVSYSIYFVVYWIQGQKHPLTSSMARAVLASAATTFVAFGSLSLSNHLGTSSMGLLLALSLFYVLFTTFLFTPALLGKPDAEHKSV